MSEKRVSVRLVAQGGAQVRAEMQGVGDSGERAFQRIGASADATNAVLRRVMGVIGAAVSVRQLVQYADAWTDLQSRVALAVRSQEGGEAVMQRLGDMARRTYSDLTQTTESWLANATALRELGMSTAETLDFTEALNNALVVSGARAERAAQISNALSQAMALGQLRGDQLNTVIMNGGRVAELLAEEMGVTVNQLRGLGAQGRITGEVIRRALVGNLERLREKAGSMPATIGDAFTLIGNAALRLVGTWDTMTGTSAGVAAALIVLADNLERVAAIGIAFAGFMAGRWVVGLVAARVATMNLAGALLVLRGALIRTGIGALIVGAGELVYWFGRLVRGAGGFGAALRLIGDLARAVWSEIGQGARALYHVKQSVALGIVKAFVDGFASIARQWDRLVNWMATPFNALMESMGAGFRLQSDLAELAFGGMSRALERRSVAYANMAREIFGSMEQTRAAMAAIRDALDSLDTDDAALDDARAAADALAQALAGAGAAGDEAAEVVVQGWARVAEVMDKYVAESMDLASALGGGIVNAFRAAESALGDFVRQGKADVREMVRSILADFAQIGARRFIFGPLARALSGALGGLGGGFPGGAALAVPSFAGGGHTGWGPRSGGLDGLGGRLALVHPGERIVDEYRQGHRGTGAAAPVHVHFHGVRDAESFRQSRSQIAADLMRVVSMGQRNS